MRRHLNTAQRSEIGLLLLEEEEKLAKERLKEVGKIKAKAMTEKGKKGLQKNQLENENLQKQIDEISKGASSDIAGTKVRVNPTYISQAKKIKEIAEKEPQIAEEWEKAKKEKKLFIIIS